MNEVWAGLTEAHTTQLRQSGISREVAEGRGYRTVTDKKELTDLGFSSVQARAPGLLFPMYSPGAAASGAGPNAFQFKPDGPRHDRSGREVKYETPKGAPSIIDVHPSMVDELKDSSVPLYITEGTKKADSGVTHGLLVVALQGVWNWKTSGGRDAVEVSSTGATAVTPDLDEIPLSGRTVYLVFDSDIVDKSGVRDALKRLGAVLARRGAVVRVVRLPAGPNGEKMGLDDYLVATGGQFDPDRLLDVILTDVVAGAADDEDDDDFQTQADIVKDLARAHYDFGSARNFGPYAVDRSGPNTAILIDTPWEDELFLLYDQQGLGTARSDSVKTAYRTLRAEARRAGEVDNLPVRTATLDGNSVVLDVADASGRAIVVRPGGWEIVDRSPVTFFRDNSLRPLPEPVGGGDLFELMRPFIRAGDEESYQLAVAWAASLALEWMLHPILYVTGPSGSGKTTMSIWLKSIIDPSSAPFQRYSQDMKDNLVSASGAWSFIYDNLGTGELKTPGFGDFLAALVTGAGITVRQLYTDRGTVSIHLKRSLLLTSVEELPFQEDVLERMVHMDVPVFDSGRTRLSDLDREFARRHPEILGAALDMVAGALAEMPNVDINGLSRLRFTDFATFLAAVDRAYGTSTLETYRDNLEAVVADRAAYSPFVRAVELLVDQSGGRFDGEPQEVLRALSSVAAMAGLGNGVPDNAVELGRLLTRETHPLAQWGIGHRKYKTNGRRRISLYRLDGGDDDRGGSSPSRDGSPGPSAPAEIALTRGNRGTGTVGQMISGKSMEVGGNTIVKQFPSIRSLSEITVRSVPSEPNPQVSAILTGADEGQIGGADAVQLTLTADSRAVLDAFQPGAAHTRSTLEAASGRKGRRLDKPLSYLLSQGVIEKVVRRDHPELDWPRGGSTGYVLTGIEIVEITAESTDRGGWEIDVQDMGQWALLGRSGFQATCRLCGDTYDRPTDSFLATCPTCQTSVLP